MRRAPFRSDFGIGWVEYDAAGVQAIRLPGLTGTGSPRGAPPAGVAQLVEELEAYFAGRAQFVPSCPLVWEAGRTPLQRDIYRRVAAIAPGSTLTYAEVAQAVGRPGAARAVGAAMAANRFAPVIPCHRVVGTDGTLRGYAGGLEMKRALLAMEAGQREVVHV